MGRAARFAAIVLIALLACGAGSALAEETALPLDDVGMRYYARSDEYCLTRSAPDEAALKKLGMEWAEALETMQRDASWLTVLTPSGRQASLRVLPAPEGTDARDVSQLDATGREHLLLALARLHGAHSAAWLSDQPDYALSEAGEQTAALEMHTLSLDTLYLNQIYSLRMEIIGRAVEDADRAELCDMAKRMLRLGACTSASDASQPLEAFALPVLTTQPAEMQRKGDEVALELEEVPMIVGGNQLSLSGTTDASAKLSYQVNGAASSWFAPGEDGSFTVLARNLKDGKDNSLSVSARMEGRTATLSFAVQVDRQDTPLALSRTTGVSFKDAFVVEGSTLPGSEVEIIKGGDTSKATVDENGRFSFTLNTRSQGAYSFTVRATYPGFRRKELKGKIRRQSEASAEKAAGKIKYAALLEAPKKVADTIVLLEGVVNRLAWHEGRALCMLQTDGGEKYLFECDHLLDLQLGARVRLLGSFTGETEEFEGETLPTLRLQTINTQDQ